MVSETYVIISFSLYITEEQIGQQEEIKFK